MSDRVVLGRLVRPVGIRGELACALGSVGRDAVRPGLTVEANRDGASPRALTVRALRKQGARFVATFDEVTSADDAATLVGSTLEVARDAVILAPGEFLDGDLVGLAVVEDGGAYRGTVAAIEHLPAGDYLVVEPGRRFVPLRREFVRSVDISRGEIVCERIAGLLDDGAEIG